MTTIRQEIPFNGPGETATVAGDSNAVIELDTAKYDGTVAYYFEIVTNSTISQAYTITLRRKGTVTDDASISVPLGTTTRARFRSTAFTPPAGSTEYVVHFPTPSSGQINAFGRIIIIQTGTITKTRTQIEIGGASSPGNPTQISATTETVVANTQYWLYDSSKWDGTPAFSAEVSYFVTSTKATLTLALQEDNGSFGGWADIVTIVSAGSATAQLPATRVRVSFTPTTGRNYRLAGSVSTTKGTAQIRSAKIIVDQQSSPTKLEAQYLIMGCQLATGTALQNFDSYFDPAEWSGVTNTYIHEACSVAAGTSDLKLQSDPNGTPADITGSTITDCVEREQSSALTMPGTAQEIDVIAISNGNNLASSRILVQVVFVTVTITADMWNPGSNQPYPYKTEIVSL